MEPLKPATHLNCAFLPATLALVSALVLGRAMERILDLGWGAGDSWRGLRVPVDHWQMIGVDIQQDRVQIARHKYNPRGWR